MLATVRLERLDLFHTARDNTGRREYLHPRFTVAQMGLIERCVCYALGMAHLLPNLADGAEDANPRKGYRAKAGAISLQGHDPTTELSFKNIRYAAIPRKP